MDEIRKLAAATYNQAYEAVEASDSPAWAIELAATSLNLWRQVGTEQNITIGCWLYSRTLAKASAGELAVTVARNALTHLSNVEDAPDWLTASTLEGYARALKAAADQEFEAALKNALDAIERIADEEDRQLISSQISDLI